MDYTFKAFEWFKDFDQAVGAKLLVVLGGDLYTDLQILSDVGL